MPYHDLRSKGGPYGHQCNGHRVQRTHPRPIEHGTNRQHCSLRIDNVYSHRPHCSTNDVRRTRCTERREHGSNSCSQYRAVFHDSPIVYVLRTYRGNSLLTCVVQTGLGRDVWTLPFSDITKMLKYYWICELLYITLTWLIRIAFVLYFLRIFPDQSFRRTVWTFIAIYLSATVACVLAVAFICTPVSFLWTGWDGEHSGNCRDHHAVVTTQAALTIVADLVTFALPLSQIWRLPMSLKKKIGVALMFSVGIVYVCKSAAYVRCMRY